MKRCSFVLRSAVVGLLLAGGAVAPAQAKQSATRVNTSSCQNPLLSQPFLASGDQNEYALLPGETPGSFNGAGWTLFGGAHVSTAPLAGGGTTSVLDLPSGSAAVSPMVCVTSDYPTARGMVRDVSGSEGVSFYTWYEATKRWQMPKNGGQLSGKDTDWTLSDPVNLQPSEAPGWQPVRFMLVPGGQSSEFQIYDLYIDPHMMR